MFTAILRASLHFPRLRFFRRLSPFPFAGLPVVAGNTALDHLVPPLIARHDEGSEVAAAEAKRGERHHNDDLQQQLTLGPSLIGKRRDTTLRQLGDISGGLVSRPRSTALP
jgi:hypothetical protein